MTQKELTTNELLAKTLKNIEETRQRIELNRERLRQIDMGLDTMANTISKPGALDHPETVLAIEKVELLSKELLTPTQTDNSKSLHQALEQDFPKIGNTPTVDPESSRISAQSKALARENLTQTITELLVAIDKTITIQAPNVNPQHIIDFNEVEKVEKLGAEAPSNRVLLQDVIAGVVEENKQIAPDSALPRNLIQKAFTEALRSGQTFLLYDMLNNPVFLNDSGVHVNVTQEQLQKAKSSLELALKDLTPSLPEVGVAADDLQQKISSHRSESTPLTQRQKFNV